MTSIKFRALTHNDHKLFFEALGEYGKDFQNIQQYMTQKYSKGGNKSSEQNKSNSNDTQEKKEQEKKEDDKKREQIRNFYNKLCGKLSQLIGKLDDRVEKVNQELYLLINYGEIWKKHGFKFNNKTRRLLEELVHQGYTILRFKNKNVRLRTPSCKALKKINQIGIDEKTNVVTSRDLPKDVIVEFHPETNCDWLRVQSISQNPRVRARLSMQKRLSSILEFLENKWNISQEKLSRTVDSWLKMPISNQPIDDVQLQQGPQPYSNLTQTSGNQHNAQESSNQTVGNGHPGSTPNSLTSLGPHYWIRLKPSPQHELKEVNVTRVIPDYHLDLSFNAYIKRLGVPEAKVEKKIANTDEGNNISGMSELSQGAMSTNSRLPVSLTTPDSSVLLERSVTSDQPSIAQARKHLNLLQTLAGSFEGCENSRTAEDTQDRPISLSVVGESNTAFGGKGVPASTEMEPSQSTMVVNNNIAALIDEDAAIDTMLPTTQPQNCDHPTHDDKSVDFHIPKNLTLDDYFKMGGNGAGDNANDPFQAKQDTCNNDTDNAQEKADESENRKVKITDPIGGNNLKPHDHVIQVEKLADGWIRQDDSSSMSIGELYLAFKCPEKIVLQYAFEQADQDPQKTLDTLVGVSPEGLIKPPANGNTISSGIPGPSNSTNNQLIYKLLTAASLSLAQIERQKLEQQHKLHDQPGARLKRRKGPSMTLRDIETTNQRVEEALKQLQPTRLSVFRRAR